MRLADARPDSPCIRPPRGALVFRPARIKPAETAPPWETPDRMAPCRPSVPPSPTPAPLAGSCCRRSTGRPVPWPGSSPHIPNPFSGLPRAGDAWVRRRSCTLRPSGSRLPPCPASASSPHTANSFSGLPRAGDAWVRRRSCTLRPSGSRLPPGAVAGQITSHRKLVLRPSACRRRVGPSPILHPQAVRFTVAALTRVPPAHLTLQTRSPAIRVPATRGSVADPAPSGRPVHGCRPAPPPVRFPARPNGHRADPRAITPLLPRGGRRRRLHPAGPRSAGPCARRIAQGVPCR